MKSTGVGILPTAPAVNVPIRTFVPLTPNQKRYPLLPAFLSVINLSMSAVVLIPNLNLNTVERVVFPSLAVYPFSSS